MSFTRIARQYFVRSGTASFLCKLRHGRRRRYSSVVIILLTTHNCVADSVVVLSKAGKEEEYSGSVVTADGKNVMFDIECKGNIKELKWGTDVRTVMFNGKCVPAQIITAGGLGPGCKKFVAIESTMQGDIFISDFSYTKENGIVKFSNGAAIDVIHHVTTTIDGKKIRLNTGNHSFTFQINYFPDCAGKS